MNPIRLEMEKPVYGGYCLARHNGKTVFVPLTLPGESCTAVIKEDHGQYAFAELLVLDKPSQNRIEPACPLFGRCGGCAYLHTDYPYELEMKKSILAESLRRTGGITADNLAAITVEYDERFRYRSHATVKVRDGIPGFFIKNTNTHIPIPDKGCLLLADELNRELQSIKPDDGDLRVSMCADKHVINSAKPETVVIESEEGLTYHHHVAGFFQANRFLRSRMLKIAGDLCSPVTGHSFIDIGCGCGFFSLYMAARGSAGWGFDVDKDSIKMAETNAALNGITGVKFMAKPAGSIHPQRYNADIVIADPPRAGLDKKARNTIKAISPGRLLYISCNPSTFARDCADFTGSGYNLDTCILIDMFPGTPHIEVIGRFTRI